MKILLLNGSGEIAIGVESMLTKRGHVVFRTYSVCEAMDALESNSIDCIVSGLGVESGCLTDEERKAAGHTLAGWFWIKNHVLGDNLKMANRIIVLSGRIEDNLKEIASEEDLEKVHLVSWKKENWIDMLMEALDLIEKSIQQHAETELGAV